VTPNESKDNIAEEHVKNPPQVSLLDDSYPPATGVVPFTQNVAQSTAPGSSVQPEVSNNEPTEGEKEMAERLSGK